MTPDRGGPVLRHTEHCTVSTASAESLYALAADVRLWPAIFEPSIFVHHLERTERRERFTMWAMVNGRVRKWVSCRQLDPDGLFIRFDQERSPAPFAAVGGSWSFRTRDDGGTDVVLAHDLCTSDDDPDTVRWALAAVDRNSPTEVAALARVAELSLPVTDLVFSFTDSVALPGSALAEVYDFVYRCDLWPERLPHVSRVDLQEDEPDIQHLEMSTVTADGSSHTTRSVRVCMPFERIVYKQLRPPMPLFGHSGRWEFATTADGPQVTAEHTVAIDPSSIPEALGEGTTLAQARDRLRTMLSGNSHSTLTYAGVHAGMRS